MILAGAVCAALFAFAGSAFAASPTYPGGGSGFDEGTEGWSAGAASCMPAALLCTSEAAYDATTGNPPGSIAAKTTVTVNLVGFFKGTATWNSPRFTVPVEAITGAEVRLDRAFSPGGLVDVEPKATFTVTLEDLSAGTSTTALSGELDGEDKVFAAAAAPVAVVGSHTYRLSIDSTTAQSTAALSALSGTTNLRFDNVGLTVRSASGGNGSGGTGGKGSGSNSLSDRQLFALLSSGTSASPALLKGRRLFVKVGCPAKVGHACRITAQGLLNKHRPATTKRTVKVPKGKSKRIALRVKPRARGKVIKRKRLLFREKVHAGKAQATVYRQRKLIRQG
ncbi:MAG TPA: hypothetical protein VK471_10455 [Solirubrobacterales bacterium]|nr:hypothetical protein [Solirubrobacterales bacterium]